MPLPNYSGKTIIENMNYWELLKQAYDPLPLCVQRNPLGNQPGMPVTSAAPLDTGKVSLTASGLGQPLKPAAPLSGDVGGGGAGMPPPPSLVPQQPAAVTGTHIEGTVDGLGADGGPNHSMDGGQTGNFKAVSFKAAFEKAASALQIGEADKLWVNLHAPKTPKSS